MNGTEIVLLIIGGLFFVISFFLPEKNDKKDDKAAEEEVKKLVAREVENIRGKIDDIVDETVNYSIEKTERALERLSNEKIMAVDEYSETVLKKINDNHNEVVFLYDLLNDKDEKLKSTGDKLSESISDLEKKHKELEEKKRIEEEANKRAQEALLETARQSVEQSSFKPIEPEVLELVDGYAVPVRERIESAQKTVEALDSSLENATRKTAQKKSAPKKTSTKSTVKKASEDTVQVHFESDNDGRKNSNEMIRKLHEEGLSNMQIARELGLGVGEVKLVIDLFASKKGK